MTALKFQGSLTLGVGTATGQVLLYDIRSSRPFLVKDHMYGLPILDVDFHDVQDLILSMDSSVIKIWRKETVCKFVEFCEWTTEILILVFVIFWNSGFLLIDIGRMPDGLDGSGRKVACMKLCDGSSIIII